jgi:hypothetical protein
MMARHLCLIAALVLSVTPARSARPVTDLVPTGEPAGAVCVQSDASGTIEAATGALVSSAVTDLPVQCLAEANHGKCVECCKAVTGCGEDGPFRCNVCSHFCRNAVPPPEPEEP